MRQEYSKNPTFVGRIVKPGLSAAILTLACLMFWVSTPVTAQTIAALPSESQPIWDTGVAKPIQGWVRFCETFPAECAVDTSEAAFIQITPKIWKTIVSINERVNHNVKPVTDQEHWGVVDHWGFPNDGKGDCEDYQLLKRSMLVEEGLPRRAMRMTVVIDELGEGHAVLTLRTTQGDLVLDNKTSSIVSWEKTGYTYVKRESQDNQAWVSLGGLTSPTTTANR